MQKFNILFAVLVVLFVACNDKIDSSVISSGAVMSEDAREIEQSLDKASYAELQDLFLDTKNINFDKNIFIIFGKNNCTYCDLLKKDIKNDTSIQQTIKDNFNPYYINISYSKTHNLNFADKTSQIKTRDFANLFNLESTPIIVLLNKDKTTKYLYPGYTNQLKSLLSDAISKDSAMGNYTLIDRKLGAL